MTTRSGILKYSPLTHTVASIRYAPWPLLAKQIDEIHDELREIAPLINNIKLQQAGPDGQASGLTHEAWMLMPSDKSFGVQFAPDQLLLYTNKYLRYDDFSSIFEKCLSVLIKKMRFIDVTNMGVRYVDHIKPKNSENISDYLTEKFLPPKVDGYRNAGGHISAEYLKEDMKLRVNSISVPGALSVPQDLIGVLLMAQLPNQQLQIETLKEKELALDMDAIRIYEPACRMDKNTVLENLRRLHSFANEFFRKEGILTDYSFKVWKGEA